jgi:hypothetical protein
MKDRGATIHKSMIMRKSTNNWKQGEGKKGNLSFLKMKANTNMKHPRITIDGESREIPLCIDTGRLLTSSDKKLFGLDELGMGVSIYFKLLKSLVIFFVLCTMLCLPLLYFYGCGDMSKQANGYIQQRLGEYTLGNLGESSQVCKSNNLRVYDTVRLWCPSGTKISELQQFGLQKVDAEEDDNQCPQVVDTYGLDQTKTLRLDLDT